MNGLLSFAYSFHKAPIAYYSCSLLFEDYTAIVLFYDTFTQEADYWGPYAIIIFWNLLFNWIDIYYQLTSLWKAFNLKEKEWTKMGILIAMMISDVFFKSPVSSSWSFENSSVMNEEWGEPINLFEGLTKELDDTLEYYGLNPIFGDEDLVPIEDDAEKSEEEFEEEVSQDTEEAEKLEQDTESDNSNDGAQADEDQNEDS